MAQFKYEVHTVPGVSPFVKKIAALRPDSASGTLYRRQSGRGQLSIPANYDRLDEIISVDPSNHANDVASLIRVYRGSDLIQELLVPVTPNLVADQPADLSCEGIEAVMDWAIVECWDWDGSADFTSTVPDWIYGGRNLIPDLALGDLGSIREEWQLWNDQTPGGTFVLRVTEPSGNPQDTNSLDFDATLAQIEGSNLTGNGLEGLSNVNDVTISGSGSSSTDPWIITFFDPPIIDNLQVFDSGSLTSALSQVTAGMLDPSPVTVSQSVDASRNPTIHGTYTDPPIQVVTTPLDTGADWSLLVNATGQFAGSQIVLNGVTPGQTYQASIRVRPTITSDFTLVIHDQFENRIKTTTPRDVNLTAGSFQELSISDIQIPEGVTRIIMRVAVVDGTPANIGDFYVNWQGAEFKEGQSATTAGQVLLDLLDDAQTDHASGGFPRTTLDFINAGFDATNDSGSAAWADSELSINIPRGMTYRKVLDRVFGQLGYEWNLTPTTGTPGEWDLNVWNPDGRGTDHSSADTPSLLLGQGTLGGSATRQIPSANRIISEGAGQFTTRARNTASEGTIGSREWYQADVSYAGSQAEEWTDKTLARFLDVSLQPRFEIADPPDTEWPIPVVDYGLADVLNVDLADGAGKVSRTVEAISWRTVADGVRWGVHTGEAQFDAFPGGGSGGFLGGTGGGEGGRGAVAVAPQRASVALSGPVDEGVRRLLDQFDRQVRIPEASAFVPTRGGGDPTWLIAASNAQDVEKEKADYVCDGTADDTVIMEVMDQVPIGGEARIVLSSGTFFFRPDEVQLRDDIHFHGMGRLSTVCRQPSGTVTAGATVTLDDNAADGVFSDMTISGAGSTANGRVALRVESSASTIVRSCWFQDVSVAIDFVGRGLHVSECRSFLVDKFLEASGSSREIQLVNNYIRGIIDMGNTVSWQFQNNLTDSSLLGTDARGVTIVGNHWTNTAAFNFGLIELDQDNTGDTMPPACLIAANTFDAGYEHVVYVENVVGLNVIGNVSYQGFYRVIGCDNAAVIGNLLDDTGDLPAADHAAILVESDNCIISGNTMSWDISGAGVSDGIGVDGDSNMVHGNKVKPSPHAGFETRHGIHIIAGNCNVVVANMLGDAADYVGNVIADSGIDTQLKFPDDPVYGDNFTDCEPTPS